MRAHVVVATTLSMLALMVGSATADDDVTVRPTGNAFGTDVSATVPGASGTGPSAAAGGPSDAGSDPPARPGHWDVQQKCQLGGTALCSELAYCADGSALMEATHTLPPSKPTSPSIVDEDVTYCASSTPPEVETAATGPTPDRIYHAFEAVNLPESTLHFQPVDNQTLVHFKSNYYTDAAPFEHAVELTVGPTTFHVDFKIRPVQFDWTFGDGTSETTSTPGAPYPKLEVTHEYEHIGKATASVTTVWGADYSVNGGKWAPVDGTVTKAGAGVQITIREATPVLTD